MPKTETKERKAPEPMAWRLIFQKKEQKAAAKRAMDSPHNMPATGLGTLLMRKISDPPMTKAEQRRGSTLSRAVGISRSDTRPERINTPIAIKGMRQAKTPTKIKVWMLRPSDMLE